MQQAFIVDALRTPFGRHGGILSPLRADDLCAHVIRAIVARNSVDPNKIDDVIMGCANQAGEDNRNVARMGALLAGLPVTVPGVTTNRLCGSGMQAFADAARLIQLGEADLVVAGGVEQMTRAPFVMGKPSKPFSRGNQTTYDTTLGWRFVNPKMTDLHETIGLGITAERVAERYQISRDMQDRLAFSSQQKAHAAKKNKAFDKEVIPISVRIQKKTKEEIVAHEDEHPRPEITLEKLAKLRPVFQTDGSVTAGNSSGINDGACALLIASEKAVKQMSLTPMARYVSWGVSGVEPSYMGMGPVPSSQLALQRAGLQIKDIEVAEINEAFAAQAVACIREMKIDENIVNVKGGAIALGHPLGASGARLVATLAYALGQKQAKYGLATMCIGVGQGVATIIEAV